MANEQAPRIAIYGVGQFGQHIARMALEKNWTIAAAYNRAGVKIGRDLGQVCGLGRDIGVVIEDCETADFSRLEADIGVVTMTNILKSNLPAYRRLMNAGLNVICHGGESYYPQGSDPSAAQEIEALAQANGVTFTGGGIWDMSRIWAGLLAVGPCVEIRKLLHRSVTESHVQSQDPKQASAMGVGLTTEEFDARGLRNNPIGILYRTVAEQVLSALGYDVTGSRSLIEPITCDVPVTSRLLGQIDPGKCIGVRMISDTETAQAVSCRSEVEHRVFQKGDVEYMYWEVDGSPRTRIRVEREDSALATAACLFNRIPDVIAAPPGIVPVAKLGPLKPSATWPDLP